MSIVKVLLKSGSLDVGVEEFSLGLASRSSWYMSHDVMLYRYGKHRRIFWDISILFYFSFLYFGGVLNKTVIPSALVGCEIVYSPIYIYTELVAVAIHHLIPSARSHCNW